MDEYMEPSEKRARVEFDLNKCVFCPDPFTQERPAVKPNTKRLTKLFEACEKRKDDIGKTLLDNRTSIESNIISFRWHANCRAKYASPDHIARAAEKKNEIYSNEDEGNSETTPSFRRSQDDQTFDWKQKCFICENICSPKHRNTWSMVESGINKEQSRYSQILAAAENKQDNVMLTRLHGVVNGDLVAVEARYHRTKNCFSKYLRVTKNKHEVPEEIDSEVLQNLMSEYLPLIEASQVFLLTSMLNRFQELLEDNDLPSDCSSRSLKRRIMKKWPEISFISQPGKSDFVCSNSISVGVALQKADELQQELQEVSISQVDSDVSDDENIILHRAIGILRQKISNMKTIDDNEYYSSNELSLEALSKFVDPLLYKAIAWLTDEKMYVEAADITDIQHSPSTLAIVCDIITKASKIATPKHLGLAVRLHHEFGSKKLIDELYTLGYCISYPEVRRFLTSAAIHVSETQIHTAGGGLMPCDIVSKEAGGQQPVAAADNWDHNERTIDGKNTTHAMTSIVIAPKSEEGVLNRIARSPVYTFTEDMVPGNLTYDVINIHVHQTETTMYINIYIFDMIFTHVLKNTVKLICMLLYNFIILRSINHLVIYG